MFGRPQQIQLLQEGPYAQTSLETRKELKQVWQNGYDNLLQAFDTARDENKIAFNHMHPHFMLYPMEGSAYVHGDRPPPSDREFWHLKGPTSGTESYTSNFAVPDETLLFPGTHPIFTIRHPGVMVPSIWKAISEVEGGSPVSVKFSSTLRWSRMLYDWYVEKGPAHGIEPIVMDAEDYMTNKATTQELCRRVGLDPEAVIDTWPKTSDEELKSMFHLAAKMKNDLLKSDGLIAKESTASFDMAKARQEWVSKYGEKVAAELEELVEQTMPDYDYLKARKLTVRH